PDHPTPTAQNTPSKRRERSGMPARFAGPVLPTAFAAREDDGMTNPVSRHYLDFLAGHHKVVLVTIKRDGRPQLSNVVYGADADTGLVRVSLTADRAKTRNASRDPRVAMHVTSPDFWSYVVAEGDAQLTPVATDPADTVVDDLVDLYRS